MLRKIITLPVLLVTMIAGAFSVGCNRPHTAEEKSAYVVKKVTKEVKLNESQQTQLKTIVNSVLSKTPNHKDVRSDLFNTIYSQVKSDRVNSAELETAILSNEQKYRELVPVITQGFSDFYATLNAEQKSKIIEMLDKMNKRWN